MNTKLLCSYFGGSSLYNLRTPESDLDERGIFMHLDSAYILGTKRFDEDRKQTKETDKVIKELSHFCNLVKNNNSEAMEVLFAKESAFTFLSPEMKLLHTYAHQFVDSTKLFACLRGYMKGELRLALGERKGNIGGKRYAKLQEVGYSPKNMVQLFRLANVGITFFNTDTYVVDTKEFPDPCSAQMPTLHEFMMSVKTEPEMHSVQELTNYVEELEGDLVTAFENRKVDRVFNEDLINQLLLQIYLPVLTESIS